VDRVLEVHRDPARSAARPSGWGYGTVSSLAPGARVTPLARPGTAIEVGALLPRSGYRY
jgi:hypothetical protein